MNDTTVQRWSRLGHRTVACARSDRARGVLVKGLLLAGLVGIGLLGAGAWESRLYPHGRELSIFAGAGLVAFEAFEWAWLGFNPLEAVFMAVGAGVVGLAVAAGNPVVNPAPTSEHRLAPRTGSA